ncbi:MAG: LysR family transcriptional regulator [Halioglobus sp.]
MFNLEDVHLFVVVAELKSFTAAGDKEQIPKSSVSRRLRKLEDQLGARLLERTTRSIQLTEVGEQFYERALLILNEVEATEQLLAGDGMRPAGHLRICAPHEFIRLHLQYILPKFAKEQPQLRLEVLSGTVGQHLLGDRMDLMIHIDEPEDSSYVARPITSATTNYYASPQYLQQHTEPKLPQDLLQHSCVVETRNPRRDVNIWRFRTDEGNQELSVVGQYIADTTYLSLKLVEEGLGIGMLPDHVCADSLAAGRVRKLFDGKHEIKHTVYAVYPSRRHVPAKVRVFLDFLARELPRELY